MARRRTRSASYYRKNPLTNTELVVGGLVTAAVVGIGGYFIYQHYQTTAALPAGASGIAALPQTGATPVGTYDPSNPASYGAAGTPSTAIPPSS